MKGRWTSRAPVVMPGEEQDLDRVFQPELQNRALITPKDSQTPKEESSIKQRGRDCVSKMPCHKNPSEMEEMFQMQGD